MKSLLLTILIILFSCRGTSQESNSLVEKTNNMNVDNDSLEKVLNRQIQSGYAIEEVGLDMMNNYKYKRDDFNAIKEVSINILKNSGYKFLDNKEFENKLDSIFSFNDENNEINFLIEYPCKREKITYQLDGNYVISNNNPLFIDPNNKLIFESLFIPELLDYKTKYPIIYQNEENISKQKIIEGTTYDIIKWKDVKNLNEIQFTNSQKLIHRNKYLFNDDKASLTWLKFNDKLFLESLVKTFGYTKDKSLVIHVLRKDYKNIDEFEKILWNKKCDGKIVFNKDVMDVITESSSEDQKKYLLAISNYIVKEQNNRNTELSKNLAKKSEILGKLAYYGTKIGEKHNMYYDFFSILGSDEGGERYDNDFKKNNYYGISDFKEIWEETKYGGVSLPGME